MKFLEKIFSIKDNNYRKEIYILGIRIRFKTKTLLLQHEIDLLRTIIEKSIDITKIPKATGNLRKVQLIKVQLLKIADIIFKKNNIEYWLEYGTLIGAIRHKGFIPWDDDIDISMRKKDYLKLPEIFSKELTGTGLTFMYGSEIGLQFIRLKYKSWVIDIFPMEYINKRLETKEEKEKFRKQWLKIKHLLFKNKKIDDFITGKINHFDIMSEADELKKEIIDKNYTQNPESRQVIRSVETMTRSILCAVFDEDAIFPLQELEFEDYKFPAPKDPLEHLYQDGYYGEYGAVMNFPRISDGGFGHTQNKHENGNYDDILTELKEITKKIQLK